MNMQVSRDQIQCKGCRKPIVLPRQSPLGIFPNPENLSTSEWPIELLHSACGRVSSYFFQDVDDPPEVTVQTSRVDDLLRVEYGGDPKSSRTRKVLYTTCRAGSQVESERERIERHLSGERVWIIDRFPY